VFAALLFTDDTVLLRSVFGDFATQLVTDIMSDAKDPSKNRAQLLLLLMADHGIYLAQNGSCPGCSEEWMTISFRNAFLFSKCKKPIEKR